VQPTSAFVHFCQVECCFEKVERYFDIVAVFGNNVERVFLAKFCVLSTKSKDEFSFDIVAKNDNNVEATFDFVERIDRPLAFDNVASTLLLVWTGL